MLCVCCHFFWWHCFVVVALSGNTVYSLLCDLNSILEWNDKDIEHYHAQRMAMDSMLCRFKATYPAELIASVRSLLEDKERQMFQIVRLMDEQQSIKWVIGTGPLIHSFGSMNLSLVIFIPLKQVAMCTCINKNQFQRIIVLAPNKQPIWFKMTFPTARILSRQSMGFVF